MSEPSELLARILRDLGGIETSLKAHLDSDRDAFERLFERLDSIDAKLSVDALKDASRVGMAKGGYWVLGLVLTVVVAMSSAVTLVVKSWLGLIPPPP